LDEVEHGLDHARVRECEAKRTAGVDRHEARPFVVVHFQIGSAGREISFGSRGGDEEERSGTGPMVFDAFEDFT